MKKFCISDFEKDLNELNDLIRDFSDVSYRLKKNGCVVAKLGDKEHNFANVKYLTNYVFDKNKKYIKLDLDYSNVPETDVDYFEWYLDKDGFYV